MAFCFGVFAHVGALRAETGIASCTSAQSVTNGASIPLFRLASTVGVSRDARAKFFVSARDALKTSTRSLVVDVRPDGERTQLWLPGAAHVSADFLSSNTLIRSTDSVLLIGNGKDDARLLAAARKVPRNKTQSVQIVSGGIAAWRRAGGEVAGDAVALNRPAFIDEKDLHELMAQGALLAAATKLAADRRFLREPLVITNNVDDQKNIAVLRQHASVNRPLILVLPNGETATRWAHVVSEALDQVPFVFVDAGNRYADFLERQRKIVADAGKPLLHRCDVR